MAQEVIKTIKVETSGADKSVKSLRDNIKQLRDTLLNLEKGTQEYDDTLNQIIKDETELTQVMKAGKDEVAKASKGITSAYVSQKQELRSLKVELEQLQPGTDAYNEKFSRAAEITANLKRQLEMLKYSSNDLGDQLSNIRGIATNMAAGFSAANAAIGLFGGESKEVQQAMLKVQQAMALIQGLQGMDGFIKKTRGLSSAMKTWLTNGKKVTAQTTAQAAATNAAAVATNAETVATETATVAQKGLNAAMEANPIGIIISALAVLLPLIDKFFGITDKIGKFLGKLFNKQKQEAKEMKEITEEAIKDNEAKYGSDWKYTQEGEKVYRDYYDSLLKMYKKDSEEFKEAQREKWEYEREVADRQNKEAEERKKKEEEDRKNAIDAAKAAKDKIAQIEQDYQSKVSNVVSASYTATYKAFRENVKVYVDYFKNISKNLSPANKELKKWIDDYTKAYTTGLDKNLNETELFVRETITLLNGLSSNEIENVVGSDFFNRMFSGLNESEISKKWRSMVATIGDDGGLAIADALKMRMSVEATRLNKQAVALLSDIVENSSDEANKKINDNIIKLFQKTIIPNINDEVSRLQTEINKKVVKLDFEIETGLDFEEFQNAKFVGIDSKAKEFEKATAIYSNSLDKLEAELKYYQQTVDYVDKNGLIPSDAYNEAIKKIEEINIASAQTQLNFFNAQAEIRRKYFDKDLDAIKANADAQLRITNDNYNKLYTSESDYVNLRRELSGVIEERDMQAAEERYNIQKESIQKTIDLYEQQLLEQTLTAQERIEIELKVADLMAEIEEGEVAHTREMNELRIQSFQTWFSYVQDAVGGIGDLIGGLADYYEADIKAKQSNNEISEEQANEMLEKVKALKISEAIISTISGAIGAFMQAVSAYPPPFGEILGGISAAAVTAAGMAQIAQIKQQKPGNSSSPSAIAVPQTNVYQPDYVESPTNDSEISNLRNAYMEQPIWVSVQDIDSAQNGVRVRASESSF